MALTIDQLEMILGELGARIDTVNRPAAELTFSVPTLTMDCPVLARLEQAGELLRLGINVATCPASHPGLAEVHRRMACFNRRHGVIRLGWDESDGAVVADADHWVADGMPTPRQIELLVRSYLTAVCACRPELRAALQVAQPSGNPTPGSSGPNDETV